MQLFIRYHLIALMALSLNACVSPTSTQSSSLTGSMNAVEEGEEKDPEPTETPTATPTPTRVPITPIPWPTYTPTPLPPPIVRFVNTSYVADEGTVPGMVRKVEVMRTGDTSDTTSVWVKTDGGSATFGVDYHFIANPIADQVQVTWAAGDASVKSVEYAIIDDQINEIGEEIKFKLINPLNASIASGATGFTRTWVYDDDYPGASVIRKAKDHEMVYYISYPYNYDPSESWPIVFSIDGADRWYRGEVSEYEMARGNRPFILVTPISFSNGNLTANDITALSEYYPSNIISTAFANRFQFDQDGMIAIANEIYEENKLKHTKFFIDGHSGGGYATWKMIFEHPELLFGASPICANFGTFAINSYSNDPARFYLPIHAIQTQGDIYKSTLDTQWNLALTKLIANQYSNYFRELIPGGTHDTPQAANVLTYFEKIYLSSKYTGTSSGSQ